MARRNYYVVLGVSEDATADDIKQAFRGLSRVHHPDCAETGSHDRFVEIGEAYDVLRDPHRRAAHDRQLRGLALGHERQQAWSEMEARLGVLLRGFASWSQPAWEPEQALAAEVQIPASAARNGTVVGLRIPTRRSCQGCGGGGGIAFLECAACDGTGVIDSSHVVQVALPAGVPDGARLRLPLNIPGVRRAVIELRVRVA